MKSTYQQQAQYGLTATALLHVKHSGTKAGDKLTDGQGPHLLVTAAGKYWRLNYRFNGKQKTLALGVYPAVSLAKARKRRDDARELLADGIDPGQAKIEAKLAKAESEASTFQTVARSRLDNTAGSRATSTQQKNTSWLEKNIFPFSGKLPIAAIKPGDVLATL